MEPKQIGHGEIIGWIVSNGPSLISLIQGFGKLFPAPTPTPAPVSPPVAKAIAGLDLGSLLSGLSWLASPAGVAVLQQILALVPKKAETPEIG